MKCSKSVEKDSYCGHSNPKMVNHLKSSCRKEANFDKFVDQLCTRLQNIKDQDQSTLGGMRLDSHEQAEAVKRYYAAFPALKKGEESPQQYYLPPPAWCRKNNQDNKMQAEHHLSKEYSIKNKKFISGKERRNSYHGQKKNKKRHNSYSRSFDSKENLPEWVTHEGVWDMEAQDPIKEFIKAIAMDEGYGTCENTVTDEIREISEANLRMNENKVPNWDDGLDFETEWVITEDLNPPIRTPMEEEIYAKFEAKFDRSIEALWSKDQANTPDDEYQDLPIDFQDLLSSPSDNLFFNPSAEKCSMISLTESIWSNEGGCYSGNAYRFESPTRSVEVLHNRFKPLNLSDDVIIAPPKTPVREIEPFSLYSYEGIYDAVPSVTDIMQSLTAINHSKECSGFTEVLPRSKNAPHNKFVNPAPREPKQVLETPNMGAEEKCDDPLYSSKTHFRPIRKEVAAVEPKAIVRYADGDTFDINSEFEMIKFHRSESGYLFIDSEAESSIRYLEYRTKSIDYSRLNLTEAQREANDLEDNDFRLKFKLQQEEKGVQTDDFTLAWCCEECGSGGKKMRGMESIWSEGDLCERCDIGSARATIGVDDREWDELLSDISAAHAQYAREAIVDRKRRHSAALRCGPCSHPHAPFLHCIGSDRPLTR